jgi:hypothetical protein
MRKEQQSISLSLVAKMSFSLCVQKAVCQLRILRLAQQIYSLPNSFPNNSVRQQCNKAVL